MKHTTLKLMLAAGLSGGILTANHAAADILDFSAIVTYMTDSGSGWVPGNGTLQGQFSYQPAPGSFNATNTYSTTHASAALSPVSGLSPAANAALAKLFATSPQFVTGTTAQTGPTYNQVQFATTYQLESADFTGLAQFQFSDEIDSTGTPGFAGWDGAAPATFLANSGSDLALVQFSDGEMIYFQSIQSIERTVAAPEPSTLALGLSGVVAGWLAVRRRK